jgi:hypothetical protein
MAAFWVAVDSSAPPSVPAGAANESGLVDGRGAEIACSTTSRPVFWRMEGAISISETLCRRGGLVHGRIFFWKLDKIGISVYSIPRSVGQGTYGELDPGATLPTLCFFSVDSIPELRKIQASTALARDRARGSGNGMIGLRPLPKRFFIDTRRQFAYDVAVGSRTMLTRLPPLWVVR